jgi:hypothetical protein
MTARGRLCAIRGCLLSTFSSSYFLNGGSHHYGWAAQRFAGVRSWYVTFVTTVPIGRVRCDDGFSDVERLRYERIL